MSEPLLSVPAGRSRDDRLVSLDPLQEPPVSPPQEHGERPAPPGARHEQNYVDIDPMPGAGR
jgi:hypothetical protein